MDDIKVLSDRKRSGSTLFLLAVLGSAFLILGMQMQVWYGAVAGALLLCSAAFQKYTVIDENGIVIVYNARVYTYREEWPFDQILTLHREYGKNPDQVMLHFMKGAMSRRILLQSEDARRVIRLAIQKNPSIQLGDVDQ